MAVVTWFLNFSKIALVFFCPEHGDIFVPNLVQIGRAAAEKIWREKKRKKRKNGNRQKNIILPKFRAFIWHVGFFVSAAAAV